MGPQRSPGTEQAPRVKSSLGGGGADLTTSSLSTQQTLLLAPRRALGSDGFPQPRGPGLHPQVTQEVCPTLSSDSWFSIFKKGQTCFLWASSAGGGRIPRGRAANALHTAVGGAGQAGRGVLWASSPKQWAARIYEAPAVYQVWIETYEEGLRGEAAAFRRKGVPGGRRGASLTSRALVEPVHCLGVAFCLWALPEVTQR